MKPDFLQQIVASKQRELAGKKLRISAEQLRSEPGFSRETLSLKSSLVKARKPGIIAEFKRRSPSRGWISPKARAGEVCRAYELSGATGISVLTDGPYFGGNPDDLRKARSATSLPILRKDFLTDPYQLYEARAWGADAVLLIASIISPEECLLLTKTAREVDLEVLLEIHGEEELGHIHPGIDLVGVNNRNLKNFETDTRVSLRLAPLLPREIPRISESGFGSPEKVPEICLAGYQGLLIGENFMKTADPGLALRQFLSELNKIMP